MSNQGIVFNLNPRLLAAPLKAAQQATSARSPHPILDGVLFNLHPDTGLTLTGSDLEQWITVCVPEVDSVVRQAGQVSFILPRKAIAAINLLPEGLAAFEFNPDRLTLKISFGPGGKNTQTHQVYSALDYPQIPIIEGSPFLLQVDDLRRVSFAAASDTTRPVFNGVYLDMENKKAVATDTIKLAVMDIDDCEGSGNAYPGGVTIPSVIVPLRAVNYISGMAKPAITISQDKTLLKAVSGDTVLITRLVPGRYPNYEQILNQVGGAGLVVEFSAAEMQGALARISMVVADNKDEPWARFRFTENCIIVSGASAAGQAEEEIECRVVKGEIEAGGNREARFTPRLVLDALKQAESERVAWELTGANTPSVVRGITVQGGDGGDGWLCVVVPWRSRD
jgi:DNA polymerase III sliding clamp (beta) subunit (PCNA family)